MTVTPHLHLPLVESGRPVRHPTRRPLPDVDIEGLSRELAANVEGEVRFDAGSRAIYAEDASNYRLMPLGVVLPKSIDDVVATVAACRQYGAPLVSRGAGTAMAGQTCNVAVVIDFSKYLDRIVEINANERYAIVEPGVICDDLKRATQSHELTFGPDPSTHNRCTYGGMLANNACGTHAQMAGKAVDNTEALDVLLYDGTRMNVGWMNDEELEARIREGGRIGKIHSDIKNLRNRYARLIAEKFPTPPRRVSGYNLDQLLPNKEGRFNLARALVGTEGTCVTYLHAKVRLVYNHPQRVVLVLGYPDVYHAADHITEVLAAKPIALEGLDHILQENLITKGGPHRKYLPLLPEGKGWLIVEFGAETKEEADEQARSLMRRLSRSPRAPSMKLLEDKEEEQHLWKVRESGLGATAFVPGKPDTWPGWEDSAVAPEKVGAYLRDLRKLFDRYGYHPALYGHFGMGCIHCRIDFRLRSAQGIERWKAFMDDATSLVVSYGGSLSGEHGDGQARAQYLVKMFGPELVQAFRDFKRIWDPDGMMNPGRIVDPDPMTSNLKLGADYAPKEPQTHFQYPEDQGRFSRATLRCVGIGKCRRLEGEPHDDVMCPSFMVLREEKHTTRGRAHLLWEMLQDDSPIDKGWRDENVKEALDLCLSCKGCKGDCPVNVDIATYKAEFLSHYWEGRLRPRNAYAFGLVDKWARIASIAPGFVNLFTQLPGLRELAKLAADIPRERSIPAFAPQTFKSWFRDREAGTFAGEKVILFADTFNNFFMPHTARAAVHVLEAAGFSVEVPRQHICCGRPLYDYGMLGTAKRYLKRVLHVMKPHLDAGTPIIMLEPSCCSVFRDELNGLFPKDSYAHKMMEQTVLLSEFLMDKSHKGKWNAPKLERQAIVQGHCHHKSIMRFQKEESVFAEMGMQANHLSSGCCGMAGAFGLERDKYEVSIGAGERVLLPAVRSAPASTFILADGFSCREQIAQRTERHALHLADALHLAITEGPNGPPNGAFPESHIVERAKAEQKRSMVRAGIVTGLTLLVGTWLFTRRRR